MKSFFANGLTLTPKGHCGRKYWDSDSWRQPSTARRGGVPPRRTLMTARFPAFRGHGPAGQGLFHTGSDGGGAMPGQALAVANGHQIDRRVKLDHDRDLAQPAELPEMRPQGHVAIPGDQR